MLRTSWVWKEWKHCFPRNWQGMKSKTTYMTKSYELYVYLEILIPNFSRCSNMESSVWCLSATSLGEDLRWQNSKQQFWSTHLSKRWKRAKVGQKRSLRQGSILLFIYYILYITLKVQVLLHRAQLVDHLLGGHNPRLPPLQIRTATGAPPPSKVPGAPPRQVRHHLVRFQVHQLVRCTIP